MATYKELQSQLAALTQQTEEARAAEVQAVIEDIRAKVAEYGLTEKDVFGRKRAGQQGRKTSTLAPKYRDPKTGAEWTGHGRAPAWIKDVKDRTKFLITSSADAAPAASAGAVSKAKSAAKKTSTVAGATAHKGGQRKGLQAAKYIEPKSGATWSGRGRAPAWLAAAKDRTKFLIAGVDTATDAGAASKAKPVARSTVAKKAVAKKVAATKAAPTKKVAVKKTAGKRAASAKAAAKKASANQAAPAAG
jgi:DNA-binding protein H-NS